MYQLSATLNGHSNDVKGISFIDSSSIASVSRDGTLRGWSKGDEWTGYVMIESGGKKFLNSVAHLEGPLVACAGQTGVIDIVPGATSLKGHSANVCSLRYDATSKQLVSSSWDGTAIVWQLTGVGEGETVAAKVKYTLKGHASAVWDALILGNDEYLTASADKTIILWKGATKSKVFEGHQDVVRGLALLDGGRFASCSNDTTVRVWSKTGGVEHVLTGHQDYVYAIASLGGGSGSGLVSVGEGGAINVWNDGKVAQALAVPDISAWTVAVDKVSGDIAVGGSEATIRIFSEAKDRWAPQTEIDQLAEQVASRVQTADIDDSQVKDKSVLDAPGKEGQVTMVKSEDGKIEAYQYSAGSWILIGEVMSTQEAQKPKEKKKFEGKEYDYVFQVDIEDGKPQLPLPYNSNENPYDAGRRFLEHHELPLTYLDEVAQFITRNAVVKYQNVGVDSPYSDRNNRGAPAPAVTAGGISSSAGPPATLEIIPHKSYLKLATFQAPIVVKALRGANDKQADDKKLSAGELENAEKALSSVSSDNAPELLTLAFKAIQSWSPQDVLPALDVLRIAIAYHPHPPAAITIQAIFAVLDESLPKHVLLATRGLVNLFSSPDGRKLAASTDIKKSAFEVLHKLSSGPERSAPRDVATATLLLNHAVNVGSNLEQASELLRDLAFFAIQFEDAESQYRVLLALGTILANNPSDYIKQESKELGLIPVWAESQTAEERHRKLSKEVLAVSK